jgi:hypothetical protein
MKLNEVKSDIDIICTKYGIKNYTINEDGSIDVDGDVTLMNYDFTEFPLKFGKITGSFSCKDCSNLTSLKGAPTTVTGNFNCGLCIKLTSLEHTPITIGKDFFCNDCKKLTSLKYAPTDVGGSFYCHGCTNLTSLEGAPTIVKGSFHCSECTSLTSLEHAPMEVTDNFSCAMCKNLTSLEGVPASIGGFLSCFDCFNLTKLSHIKSAKILKTLHTPITNLLYVFKIKGLTEVNTGDNKLDNIINKHLTGNRDIMDCQEEMIESGFGENARLK